MSEKTAKVHKYHLLFLRKIMYKCWYKAAIRELAKEVPWASNLSWKLCTCDGTRHGAISQIHSKFYESNTSLKELFELCNIGYSAQVTLTPRQHKILNRLTVRRESHSFRRCWVVYRDETYKVKYWLG
jgi:hypothetical protein